MNNLIFLFVVLKSTMFGKWEQKEVACCKTEGPPYVPVCIALVYSKNI